MSRYIDADALIEDFKRQYKFLFGDDSIPYGLENGIKTFPTADVVEVVRCKDCENWDRHWISSLFSENVHYCSFIDGPCNGDFYCGAAIKRQVWGGDKN